MAWTSMHFAIGMMGSGMIGGIGCVMLRKGWKYLPGIMTVGGMWGIVPDLPRIWREDFPWLPFADVLGKKSLERGLHDYGDIFFLHKQLDAQPHEYALHGLAMIIGLYVICSGMMVFWGRLERRKVERELEKRGIVWKQKIAMLENQLARERMKSGKKMDGNKLTA